jgi:hypothetical protein
MTVSSVKTGELSLSFALNNNFMEPIASIAGGAKKIMFTDIPQGYKHLQIRGILSNDAANYAMWRINGDYGTNYAAHVISGDGSTASATALSGTLDFFPMGRPNYLGRNGSGTLLSAFVIDILDYTNTNKYKTIRTLTGWDSNGGGSVNFESAVWMSTAPVTSIQVEPTGTNSWVANSRISLYGIKG